MNPDKYYGAVAENYEAERNQSAHWQAEQNAVSKLVTCGPVLDIPIGTGRYLPIYEAKGLWPHAVDVSIDMIQQAQKKRPRLDYKIGSITAIPHPDRSFKTAVCTRLLNWLSQDDMQVGVTELHRVADNVVFSIRLGDHQQYATVTHDEDAMLDALCGAWIAEKIQIRDEGAKGIYWMFKSRFPTWQDVEDQFRWNKASLQTLADEWCERYGVPAVAMQDRPVACLYLTGREIWAELEKMAEVEPALIHSPAVKNPPRNGNPCLPIVWLDFGDKYGQVDGRHRAYARRESDERFPVFVVAV